MAYIYLLNSHGGPQSFDFVTGYIKLNHCWTKLVLSYVNISETATVHKRVPAQTRYIGRNTNCGNATANAFAVGLLQFWINPVILT